MVELVAQWADRWNIAWYGKPNDRFRQQRQMLVEACARRGRDVSQIELSVGLAVTDQPSTSDSVRAHPDDLAEALAAWQAEGVDEVICNTRPLTGEVIEIIASVAETVRP